jgi:hypothetical protein
MRREKKKMLSNFTPVDGAWSNHRNMIQNQAIFLQCFDDSLGYGPDPVTGEHVQMNNFDVSGQSFGSQIKVSCPPKHRPIDRPSGPQSTGPDTGTITDRYGCTAYGNCTLQANGPFENLQACLNAGCGPERPEDIELDSNYIGPTMRPYSGGPLQETIKKNIRKKLNKR